METYKNDCHVKIVDAKIPAQEIPETENQNGQAEKL
jgi:hypothetical protein